MSTIRWMCRLWDPRTVGRALMMVVALVLLVLVVAAAAAGQLRPEVTGEIGFETRGFLQGPLLDEQARHDASLLLQGELYWSWDGGNQSLTVEPFLRLDTADSERTHVDFRVFSWEKVWDRWELRAGLRREFWGVTESQHLVDVINQTDLVENLDGEDKLGQPMVSLAAVRDWGTLELFLLTGFRERTFPGEAGRLRFPLTIGTEDAVYESAAGGSRLDWAARWSHAIGGFDLGVAHFQGTAREPRLEVGEGVWARPVLVPHYDVVDQTSLDAQYTSGGWLLKFEGITRSGGPDGRYYAMTGGFEYTIPQVLGADTDLGIVGEVILDDRGDQARTPFEDDVFVGMRFALNDVQDTQLLAGAIVDRDTGATLFSLEGRRRVGESWTLDVEARSFIGVGETDLLYGFRRDGYLSVAVSRHF